MSQLFEAMSPLVFNASFVLGIEFAVIVAIVGWIVWHLTAGLRRRFRVQSPIVFIRKPRGFTAQGIPMRPETRPYRPDYTGR